jgi:hypothetical protein
MRKTGLFMAFSIGIAFIPASHCLGQNCMQLMATPAGCTGPNNCQQTVSVNRPQPAQYGFTQGPTFNVACCDDEIPSYTEGDNCEGSDLKGKSIRSALAEQAKAQPIMVASCIGQYSLYREVEPSHDLALSTFSTINLLTLK